MTTLLKLLKSKEILNEILVIVSVDAQEYCSGRHRAEASGWVNIVFGGLTQGRRVE